VIKTGLTGRARTVTVWLSVTLAAMALAQPTLGAAGSSTSAANADGSIAGIPLAKLRKLEHAQARRGKGITVPPGDVSSTNTTTSSAGTASTPTTSAPRTSTTTSTVPSEIAAQIKSLEQGKTPGATHAATKHASSKLSGTGILLAVVASILVLCALLWALFSFAVLEPHWLLSLRHSLAEAGYRASAVWAEFTDWVRLGH
jgi:cobalamin biosynthesis Mg chelatase CobN